MENQQNLPSLRQQPTGLTKQVEEAFSAVRINQLPDSQVGEIRKLLLQLFLLTGLRNENFPDPIQTDVLINFIREDLGNYTLNEIGIAFRLAIKNELDTDPNHYQAFSAAYIARIMSAYVPVRTSHLKSVRANENALKLDSKMEHTQSEMDDIKKGYILECLIKPWRYYLKCGKLTFGITPMSIIYNTLVNDLELLVLEKDEKISIKQEAIKKVELNLNKNIQNMDEYRKMQIVRHQIEKEGFEKAMDFEIKSMCYEMAVKNYFESCYKNKVDLESLISNKLNHKF